MTWFKIDDGFADHPKVEALLAGKCPDAALALWTLAGSWCARHLTDGAIPRTKVARLGVRQHELGAAELVRVGLWIKTEEGFQFHDWRDHQPTREDVLSKRQDAARRKAKSRKKTTSGSDADSGSHDVTQDVTHHVTRDGTRDVGGSHNRLRAREFPSRPDPTRPEESESSRSFVETTDDEDGFETTQPTSTESTGRPSLRTLGDQIRAGVVTAFKQIDKPPPLETKNPLWKGWQQIAGWVREQAEILSEPDEVAVARHLVRCWMQDRGAIRKGRPVAFLVQNPLEYWRDVSEVA